MKQLFGGILIAVGILIAGASGLCSLMVLFGGGEYSGFGMWVPVLMFGGIPFVLGAALVLGGRRMVRRAGAERGDADVADIFE